MSTDAPAAALDAALRDLLPGSLAPGDAAYAVDGFVPALVATPSSADELAAALALADEHGAAVIPWGGGRHMALGNVPSRCDLALRTTKLDRVLEHEPADLTITVAAGITIGRLQAHLAGHGQFLPIDAPGDATIGGVLAANVSGPSRHAYGLPRDWLIGCRVAHVGGSISKGGGRVVKNVAGYDMPKLAVGSLGTLGVIVEVTLKVAPLPAAQETLVVQCDSLTAAAALVFAADDRGLALRAVALLEGPTAAFWLAGLPAAVQRTSRELRDLARGSDVKRLEGQESEHFWSPMVDVGPHEAGGVSLKASLPPAAVAGFVGRCDFATIAYPTTGLVLANLEARAAARVDIDALRRAARDAGGSLVVMSAPAELKRRIDVWGDAGDALPLMRQLKEQFDPRGTLNPGRYVGGL